MCREIRLKKIVVTAAEVLVLLQLQLNLFAGRNV
jgi:hypothetical protein